MASVTMTLEEWRIHEAALLEARSFALNMVPEHPAWDADPPAEIAADEHAVWRWRFDQVRGGPAPAAEKPAEVAPEPVQPPSNAAAVADALLKSLRRR